MSRNEEIKKQWLSALLKGHEELKPTPSLSSTVGDLSLEEAYEVQGMLVEEKIKRGERIIGWKVGITSRAIMEQLDVKEPIFGCMTSGTYYSAFREVKASDFCRLAVETEIAVVMGKTLRGPGITHMDAIMAASGAMASVELVDCRYEDWKATLAEGVADNAYHAGIILGSVMGSIPGFDLTQESLIVHKNGELLGSACGIEALGNPLNVVTWLANKLTDFHKEIRAGDVISTGSLMRYFFVEPGDVIDVSYSSLGRIHFTIKD